MWRNDDDNDNDNDYDNKSYNSDDSDGDINDRWGEVDESIFDNGDEDSDDDGEGVDIRAPGAEHLLVLLDCSPDMFVPCMKQVRHHKENAHQQDQEEEDQDDGDKPKMISPMDAVISALQTYVRQTVRTTVSRKDLSGKRNGFGIHLFGTRERERLDLNEYLEEKLGEKYQNHDTTATKLDDYNDDLDGDDGSDPEDEDDDDDDDPKSSYSSNITDLHELIRLDVPGLDTISKLCFCTETDPSNTSTSSDGEGEERILDLKQIFGHPDDTPSKNAAKAAYPSSIKKAFREIANIFKDAKFVRKKGAKHNNPMVGDDIKTVWVFTNNPCTSATDQDRHSLESTARDLKRAGIKTNIWPLPSPHHQVEGGGGGGFSKDSIFHKIAEVPPPSAYDEDLDLEGIMARRYKATRQAFVVPLFFPDAYPQGWDSQNKKLEVDSENQSQQQQAASASAARATQQQTQWSQTQGGSDKQKVTLPPSIMLNFYLPSSTQREPPKIKILREVGLNDEFVELERVSYLQGTSGTKLAHFVNSATVEEKKQEKDQSGLKRIGKFVQLKGRHGARIAMNDTDVAQIKRQANLCGDFASLVLLGFKPRGDASIPLHYNLKSYFAYPDDKMVEGSVEAFAHLHQSMINKNVVGIGELLSRRAGTSKLVHIVPIQAEYYEDDEDNGQTFPPGWLVCQLPFENEMNGVLEDVSTQEGFDVSPEVLNATKELIRYHFGENFDMTGDYFENPYLQLFWDYVEAVALQKDLPMNDENKYVLASQEEDELDDLRKLAEDLKLELPEDPKAPPKKRKLEATNTTNWKVEMENGRLADYKNDDLKEALKEYGEKVTGKKEILVQRLTNAILNAEED